VPKAEALKARTLEAASALGFIGAVGGYLVRRVFGASIAATGGPRLALWVYLTFHAVCIAMTWWCFLRSRSWQSSP
jgi:MFS transporter, NNP family, nitrate/nitrite transporter